MIASSTIFGHWIPWKIHHFTIRTCRNNKSLLSKRFASECKVTRRLFQFGLSHSINCFVYRIELVMNTSHAHFFTHFDTWRENVFEQSAKPVAAYKRNITSESTLSQNVCDDRKRAIATSATTASSEINDHLILHKCSVFGYDRYLTVCSIFVNVYWKQYVLTTSVCLSVCVIVLLTSMSQNWNVKTRLKRTQINPVAVTLSL